MKINVELACIALFAAPALMAAPNPASQDWVKEHFTPITPAINWSSLCSRGQSLTDPSGCSPNCNTGP